MKTKFTSILKVKKLEVEKLESQIIKLQNQKKSVLQHIEKLKKELRNIKIPESGGITDLQQIYYLSSILKNEIKLKEENIKFLNEQIELTQDFLKRARIDYEKIKHLHEIEEKKILEKIKRLEDKKMDEIASQLFNKREK